MVFGSFFKSRTTVPPTQPEVDLAAEQYAVQAENFAARRVQQSWKIVALITLDDSLRQWLRDRLGPMLTERGYLFLDQATAEQALDAAATIFDGTPRGDSRLHDQYDKVLRQKKSLGKRDVMAIFGRRQDHKRYPRGTWPGVLFFCLKDEGPEEREPDLTTAGTDTVVGPKLFNFVDLPAVLAERLPA